MIDGMSEEFQKEIRFFVNMVLERTAQGDLPPLVILGNTNTKERRIFPGNFATNEQKRMFTEVVRGIAIAVKPDFALTAFESYMLSGDESVQRDFTRNRDKYKEVKDHPAARDGLFISVETKSSSYVSTYYVNILDDKREIIPVNEGKFSKMDRMEGIFSNFLPRDILN